MRTACAIEVMRLLVRTAAFVATIALGFACAPEEDAPEPFARARGAPETGRGEEAGPETRDETTPRAPSDGEDGPGKGRALPAGDPCEAANLGDGWYCAASLDPTWSSNELYHCVGGRAQTQKTCPFGCRAMPPGQHDVCAPDPSAPIQVPRVTIDARGMYFTEATVRGPIESGLKYMLSRIATSTGTTGTVTPITLVFRQWGNSYCGGRAGWDRAEIWCPNGYPIQGDNQNYVVNITMHEIGHILAAQLFGSPAAAGRDTCENEGLASWIAGKYWMNKHPAIPVGSFREAALDDIARGRAQLSMTNCVSASDGWYTVYASFFEYLEKFIPNGVRKVATGAVAHTAYIQGWKAWMQQ